MKLLRLLIGLAPIDSRWMAYLITFSVGHACSVKGILYLIEDPSPWGWVMFALSPLTAVVAGVTALECVKLKKVLASAASQHRAFVPSASSPVPGLAPDGLQSHDARRNA